MKVIRQYNTPPSLSNGYDTYHITDTTGTLYYREVGEHNWTCAGHRSIIVDAQSGKHEFMDQNRHKGGDVVIT